jgi:inorganic phosphate transporter, PiT family
MVSLLIAVVIAAIVFDYINGFHDAANAIATVVSTGVLPIRTAVLLAAILNFAGAVMGTAVASTIAKGFADPATVTQSVVLAALLGASVWNLITWWYGIPSSSSHALIGGLAGAVVAHAGFGAFKWAALVQKVLVPLVVSPTVGFLMAFFLMVGLLWLIRGGKAGVGTHVVALFAGVLTGLAFAGQVQHLTSLPASTTVGGWVGAGASALMPFLVLGLLVWLARHLSGARPGEVQRTSRRLQLVSASLMAFSHGSNDAQKAMGIITLALLSFASKGMALPEWAPSWLMPVKDAVPTWVVVTCAAAIALGTAAGGTRIIKTMGTKIIRITPLQGFAAETAGALTILMASRLGIPVSTTHCINACIMGVGASKRVSAVRWGVATNILIAWVLTLPLSGALAWVSMKALAALGA